MYFIAIEVFPFFHLLSGPSHSIIPLAVALTLIAILAISTLAFWINKHSSGAFRRLLEFRNPYYPTTNFSTAHLEENILISDLENSNEARESHSHEDE